MSDLDEHTTTITFDPPFWVVLFERIEQEKYSVAKEIIGTSEPTNADIILFFERLDYNKLRYTVPVLEEKSHHREINFKKMQKKIKKATEQSAYRHTYSKAHEELKKQREENKVERKLISKLQREEKSKRKFELKQQKKKQKLRGR